MKRIVIFIDGTRNKPDAEHPTNVVQLAQSIKQSADKQMKQIVLYSTGVGSGQGNTWVARKSDSIFGGALGWGLTAIIVNAYRELMFVYEPGDEIMVFGFSRGAFAARSLVGLIRTCGILERGSLRFLPEAIKRYRSMSEDCHPDSDDSHEFRLEHSPRITTNKEERDWRVEKGHDVADVIPLKIAFLGVWDTVSAMGLPEILPVSKWFNVQYRFHDTELSSMVEAARHAISIDEHRRLYPSYPWTNLTQLGEDYDRRLRPTHLQQWFPGNHGSVGGGGSITGLSSIALNWIILGARQAGLAIDYGELDRHAPEYDFGASLRNRPDKPGVRASIMGSRLLGFLNGNREGPDTLEDVSMSAVDRRFEKSEYLDTPSLEKVHDALSGMDDAQRDQMRKARQWVDGALTHLPGRKTRPRTPDEDVDPPI
jgi:uncharacterized protein (DUF2235 family)